MNFSVGKNDKPDEQPSGVLNESRNHIIRQTLTLLHRRANRMAATIKGAHRYNPRAPKSLISTCLSPAKTCRYP
jgi:hypothetical protein